MFYYICQDYENSMGVHQININYEDSIHVHKKYEIPALGNGVCAPPPHVKSINCKVEDNSNNSPNARTRHLFRTQLPVFKARLR